MFSASANVVRKSFAQVMLRAPVLAVAGAGGVGGFLQLPHLGEYRVPPAPVRGGTRTVSAAHCFTFRVGTAKLLCESAGQAWCHVAGSRGPDSGSAFLLSFCFSGGG